MAVFMAANNETGEWEIAGAKLGAAAPLGTLGAPLFIMVYQPKAKSLRSHDDPQSYPYQSQLQFTAIPRARMSRNHST